jgi:hypothetical protein
MGGSESLSDYQKFQKSDQDVVLFKEIMKNKTIKEVNDILNEKEYYYHGDLIKEICDGRHTNCNHIMIVNTDNDKIISFRSINFI